tara:strand:- start:175 stop:528 length:354 start_codon:yes stop_codon:yes gene_type:complete
MKEIKNIKIKEHLIDKKQMLVVYFDFSYPMDNENIEQVTQAVSNIVNEDRRFINRVIFLPKGFDMYNLSEDDFINIWKSKVDADKVDELMKDDKIQDLNQLELFETKNDVEVIETNE